MVFFAVVCTGKKINNKGIFSFSPESLQRFARGLARVAFLQADQCNNSGETEEVVTFESCYYNDLFL